MENEKEMTASKKERAAIAVGFLLILIVVIITLFRSNLFEKEDNKNQLATKTVQEDNGLEYKTITAVNLNKKIILKNKDEVITLLDVRPFESYAAEHIADTVNTTPDQFPIEKKIDSHSLVVIIGQNPDDENIQKTIKQLNDEDFKNYLVLAGGMDSWKQFVGNTVTYGNPKSFEDQMKVSYVKGEDLNSAIKENVPTYIIDVRSKEEYAKGHIHGAINIPAEEVERRRTEITEKRVVVVGINELQEFQSSVQMYDMLLISPFVLKGGMPEWEKNGYALEK